MSKPKRPKRNEPREEHWTKLIRPTMETPAWRALSSTAQALYPWVKLEWRGPQANNNGKIRLSVRQAAARMNVDMKTAARAFHDLQAKGFLFVIEAASLGFGGEAKSPSFEITELPMPLSEQRGGRKLYDQWRPGADWPVCKAAVHNPRGLSGKPCPRKGNGTVVVLGTNR